MDGEEWRRMFLFALLIGGLGFAGGLFFEATNTELEPVSMMPDQEYNVTCYKWVENGTARVICPEKVYAPDSVVNITVKHCDEYEYVVDEPHPCYG